MSYYGALHCNPTFSLLWNLYSCFFRYSLLKNTWKWATNRIFFFACLDLYVSAKIAKQLQVKITCDGLMTVYSGRLQPEHSTKNVSANYIITPGNEILAVRCRNFNSKPWILGSFSNGMITDPRWKCFSFPKHEHFNGNPWTKPEFNDNHWPQAVAGFSNRGESPVGKVMGINDDALWISTSEDNPSLFCRRNLSDDATLPLTSIQDISRGMSECIW